MVRVHQHRDIDEFSVVMYQLEHQAPQLSVCCGSCLLELLQIVGSLEYDVATRVSLYRRILFVCAVIKLLYS